MSYTNYSIRNIRVVIVLTVAISIFLLMQTAEAQLKPGLCCKDGVPPSKPAVSCVNLAGCAHLNGYECIPDITTCPGSTEQAAEVVETPITFTAKSGIEFTGDVGPALLANYMIALNKFFFRLAIVLAVFMITLGGLQWLMAIGNASRISNAKDTLQQAIIGLILALTAFLLFSQIDESFVSLKVLNVLEKPVDAQTQCSIYKTPDECTAASCLWAAEAGKDCEQVICCGMRVFASVGSSCFSDNHCTGIEVTIPGGPTYGATYKADGYCIGNTAQRNYPGKCTLGNPGEFCWFHAQCKSDNCQKTTDSGAVKGICK